ncbi:DUF3109 family protein [Albibacterium profundi]|uniref:DUF3109 family protein n=1 Tax=Albibacterium profundi TaxID=3134906 RepID=A0ABV5CCH9_9SPHI
MIEIDGVLVSEDLIKEEFVCNLNACKGACCIEGDSGAPLEKDELEILERIYPAVKPYMTTTGIETIEARGTHVVDDDGDLTTPCVDKNKECAYVTWENGITKCAIEKAFEDGKIDWQKPISCHLYPIRITQYPEFDVLNYDRWHICHAACSFGKQLNVPVYNFVKAPLIRKYGEEWFKELEDTAKSDVL